MPRAILSDANGQPRLYAQNQYAKEFLVVLFYVAIAFVAGVVCGWALLKWVASLRVNYVIHLLRKTNHRTHSQRRGTHTRMRYSQRRSGRRAVRTFNRGVW